MYSTSCCYLCAVPGAVCGMVGEHEVGGGEDDDRHESGGQEPPHHLPVQAGPVTCTHKRTEMQSLVVTENGIFLRIMPSAAHK